MCKVLHVLALQGVPIDHPRMCGCIDIEQPYMYSGTLWSCTDLK